MVKAERLRAIEDSAAFLVVMTKYWVREPELIEELEHAKRLGKPVIVAVFDGVDPGPYLRGARVVGMREFRRESFLGEYVAAEAFVREALAKVGEN